MPAAAAAPAAGAIMLFCFFLGLTDVLRRGGVWRAAAGLVLLEGVLVALRESLSSRGGSQRSRLIFVGLPAC